MWIPGNRLTTESKKEEKRSKKRSEINCHFIIVIIFLNINRLLKKKKKLIKLPKVTNKMIRLITPTIKLVMEYVLHRFTWVEMAKYLVKL